MYRELDIGGNGGCLRRACLLMWQKMQVLYSGGYDAVPEFSNQTDGLLDMRVHIQVQMHILIALNSMQMIQFR